MLLDCVVFVKDTIPVNVTFVPLNYAASLVANYVAVAVYKNRPAVYVSFPVPPELTGIIPVTKFLSVSVSTALDAVALAKFNLLV